MALAEEDLKSKREFMHAFFDDLNEKINFLGELKAAGRPDEALMLCCVYLDGLGNALAGTTTQTTRNFCRALIQYGGEPVLSLVLPRRLEESLPWKSAPAGAATALRAELLTLPEFEALTPGALIEALSRNLLDGHVKWMESEIWRGTVANAVHARIRSLNIHNLGSAGGLSFSKTSYAGNAVPDVDFDMLLNALRRIADHAGKISFDADAWFGLL